MTLWKGKQKSELWTNEAGKSKQLEPHFRILQEDPYGTANPVRGFHEMLLYKAAEGSSFWSIGYSSNSLGANQINSKVKRHKEELPRCKIKTPCSGWSGKRYKIVASLNMSIKWAPGGGKKDFKLTVLAQDQMDTNWLEINYAKTWVLYQRNEVLEQLSSSNCRGNSPQIKITTTKLVFKRTLITSQKDYPS